LNGKIVSIAYGPFSQIIQSLQEPSP
jgi:hypothetical protein